MSITINKLNPVGYKSQTPDGQTYQKSNIGKTIALAGTAACDIYFSNSKNFKNKFSAINILKNDLKINIPNKYAKPVEILGYALDLGIAYGVGSWIDQQINKHRIKKLSSNNH